MRRWPFSAFTLLCFLGGGVSLSAQGDQHALIDTLVRKKILTVAEGNELKADMVEEEGVREKQKVRLSESISELRLSGDLKVRYQGDRVEPREVDRDDRRATERNRFRFRLRLNADFVLHDGWFGGLQLQTSNYADSGFQTYSGGFRNYDLFLSRAFVGWNATEWATLIIGKQANPFFTTDLLWDADINPSGLVERVRLSDWWLEGDAASRPWSLSLVAGQFFFADNSEWGSPSAYLFAQQLIFDYTFANKTKVTVGPAFLTYNAARATGALNSVAFSPERDEPLWINETSALAIIQIPGEVKWKVGKMPVRFLWDFAYNTAGAKRMHEVYGIESHTLRDDLSFLVGVHLGETKKKGDYSLYLNYRQVGMASIDPNLNDSTFGFSRLNVHGFKGGAAYSFTDAVVASLTYSAAWKLRDGVKGGQATKGAKLANAEEVQLLQVDLDVKF